jgi:PAS domain S-box-containing protein
MAKASKENEGKFQVPADVSAAAIIVYQGEDLVNVNRAAEKISGYSSAALLGKKYWDLIHPDFKELIRERGRIRQHSGAVPSHYEVKFITKAGEERWAELYAGNITYQGKPAGVLTFFDITERKRVEAELKRVNRALKTISKCNEAVIRAREESALLYDVCKLIVEVGGYRMAWIGYAINDENKSIEPIAMVGLGQDYVEKAKVTWADTERGRGPSGTALRSMKPCIIKNVTTDPNFIPWREDAIKMGYNSVIGLPLSAGDGPPGVLTIYSEKPDAFDREEFILLQDLADNLTHGIISLRDRLKRAEVEAALKSAKADAELYVDLMGHDINNMNQISLGFLELARNILETDGKLGEENVGLLDKAMDSLNNSSQLISNVRKLQREKMGLYGQEVIHVSRMAEDIVKQFKSTPGRNVNISYYAHDDCLVMANALLKDVFINLIGNAIKHSSDDIHISIRVERIDDERPYCRVSVEDDGPGIPDTLKKTLFDRLSLTATRVKGKGFGLCLIKILVDSYHGKFWVEDRIAGDPAKGTRFVVMLPEIDK